MDFQAVDRIVLNQQATQMSARADDLDLRLRRVEAAPGTCAPTIAIPTGTRAAKDEEFRRAEEHQRATTANAEAGQQTSSPANRNRRP